MICGINRLEFDKKQISYKNHVLVEHNYIKYIQYFMCLKFLDENEMDSPTIKHDKLRRTSPVLEILKGMARRTDSNLEFTESLQEKDSIVK